MIKGTDDLNQKIKSILYLLLFIFMFVYFIISKIKLMNYSGGSSIRNYSSYNLIEIPFVYIYDYFDHAWNSLILAFMLGGFIQEFIPKDLIKKVLGSGKFRDYIIAAALAPIFITCSCSVIPVYVGILMAGASIGVAMTFFLMAPAANFITIMLTGEYVGWDLGIWRLIFSFIAAIMSGFIFDRTKLSKKLQAKYDTIREGNAQRYEIEINRYERIQSAYLFSWKLIKNILPLLLLGLVIVSYLAAFLPDDWVSLYFTGITGIIIAALLGGPLYTPTLVEIVLTQALLKKGMSRATALSFMMGQPYDIVSMVPNSKYFKWKGVAIYTAVFFVWSILAAIIFGLMIGEF